MKCNEYKIYYHLEGLEVIDKDVGQPEQIDQLQVDGDQGLVTLSSLTYSELDENMETSYSWELL